jgi:hypothetical protein
MELINNPIIQRQNVKACDSEIGVDGAYSNHCACNCKKKKLDNMEESYPL